MLLDTLAGFKRSCTGCGACSNVCAFDAITMKLSKEGFYQPEIDVKKCVSCYKCEQVCPQIAVDSTNSDKPECYAVQASEDVLKISSSGGVFSVLAGYVLDKGGYVVGAAYDSDHRGVSMTMVSSYEELELLRGSKYVQSKSGNIYKQVKDKLDEGAFVLFTGLPCQVAALRNLIGADSNHEKLIVVDLICGGVPSARAYNAYLDEVSEGREIVSVNCRPKKYSWKYSGIETVFADGSVNMDHNCSDPYLRGYSNWLYMNDACERCSFIEPFRHGDLTIGDFWYIDRYTGRNPAEFKLGVSSVVLNNEKAKKLFSELSESFDFVKRMPLDFLRNYNRLNEFHPHHLGRPRFFDMLDKGASFSEAVDRCLGWKFDIALTGCWTARNYGIALSYYAFYRFLKSKDKNVIMVERRKNLPNYYNPEPTIFAKNPFPYYDVSRIHKNFEDQRELNDRVCTFVLGSDPYWCGSWLDNEDTFSYLSDYCESWKKRIAYSLSLGKDRVNNARRKWLAQQLGKYDRILAGSAADAALCDKLSGKTTDVVADPILLYGDKVIAELIENSQLSVPDDAVLFYVSDSKVLGSNAGKIAEKLNTRHGRVVHLCEDDMLPFTHYGYVHNYDYVSHHSVEDWLKYISECSLLVTDSYYAVCVAILLRKRFVLVKSFDGIKNSDAVELLKALGLEHLIISSVSQAAENDDLNTTISYDEVKERISQMRERSIELLMDALESDKEIID